MAIPLPRGSGALDSEGEDAIKIILLGDSAVGKSKLVERFLMQDYQPRMLSTYALTLFRHNAEIHSEQVAVPVEEWPGSGQPQPGPQRGLYVTNIYGGCCISYRPV